MVLEHWNENGTKSSKALYLSAKLGVKHLTLHAFSHLKTGTDLSLEVDTHEILIRS
jgi:hypothetical protein